MEHGLFYWVNEFLVTEFGFPGEVGSVIKNLGGMMPRGRPRKNKDARITKNDDTIGSGETPIETGTQETDEVKAWIETIQSTENWRDNIANKNRWKILEKEYRGNWTHLDETTSIPVMPVNLIFAFVKTEIARLYFKDPHITVNAKRIEELAGAEIAEALINYKWMDMNLKEEIKRAMIDALLVGHGWIKLGYSAEIGIAEDKPAESEGEKTEKEATVNEFIKSEDIFAYHVPWKDVLFSPDSIRPPHDSRWLAFRVVRPLRAIKESGIYNEDAVKDLKPVGTRSEDDPQKQTNVNNVTLWEIWDMDHRKVKTISAGCEKFLRNIDMPYDIKGYPAVMFSFNIVNNEPYPMSEVGMWEPQVIELMKMISIMINHLKRWNRQIFVKEGFMTEIELDKFKKGTDGAIIRFTGNQSEMFIPPYAPVQQDVYGVWNLIMQMWQTVSGQTETDRAGQARTQTRTLGELRLQMQGGQSRSDEKLDSLEDKISELAEKLITIMRQKMTLPKIIRMVGPKKVEEALLQNRPSASQPGAYTSSDSFSTNGNDIPKDIDIDTVAGSTIPLNKENKIEMLTELMKIEQAFGIVPGGQAARELGRTILNEMNVPEMDRVMDIADQEAQDMAQNQQSPEQQQALMQAQQEAQQSQMEIEKEMIKAQASKTQAEAQVIQSKVNSEIAKLKFQEQVIKHLTNARQMENKSLEMR